MSIDLLKSKLGTGARPNKYQILMSPPTTKPSEPTNQTATVTAETEPVEPAEAQLPSYDKTYSILSKATSLPAKTMGVLEAYSAGKKLVIAGETEFENTWQVTFYNDSNMNIKKIMENWMSWISDTDGAWRFANMDEYTRTITVIQLSVNNEFGSTFELYNAWPSEISSIELTGDQVTAISEIVVTFTFTHWSQVKNLSKEDITLT